MDSSEHGSSRISVQFAGSSPAAADEQELRHWARLALGPERDGASLCIRVVDEDEGRELNRQWRQRDRATNVLSFPASLPAGTGLDFIGDLVLCAPVIEREASEQGKSVEHHWAHMVIHGVLHLLGFDHISEQQAERMEAREAELLAALGMPDPYLPESDRSYLENRPGPAGDRPGVETK